MDLWSSIGQLDALSGAIAFSDNLPSGYEYATLGARSTVDLIQVNGAVLRPGSVVPLNGHGGQIQGWRAMPARHTPNLQLALWKACEEPIPGARAPFAARSSYTYAAGADNAWTERVVLPMAGRRNARISFSMDAASGVASYDYALVGFMYGTRDGAAVHRVTSDGSGLLVPTANVVDAASPEAYVVYVGGWDAEEAFDELAIYTRKPLAGTVVAASILAECWGDLGAGH